MTTAPATAAWERFDEVRVQDAALALRDVVRRTPLVALSDVDPRLELRAKLENRQETGSFKTRGAWNQVRQLSAEERAGGVVACSSGNHGKALAWAARRAGVPAVIVMPADAYPNKIAACRELGAEVVLVPSREEADTTCARLAAEGRRLVHPYDDPRTVSGAGTVGLEIAQEWPEVEVVVLPIGGGGLASGSSLALRRALGGGLRLLGVEPAGAPTMTRGLEAGGPVVLAHIETAVQGLCPLYAGGLNVAICAATLDRVLLLEDAPIFDAQRELVRRGETVEPAGAAAAAAAFGGRLPEAWTRGRGPADPLRVAVVVSGGNPDPAQLERLRSGG